MSKTMSYASLDEARLHDVAVHAWLTRWERGEITREQALEGLALQLANEVSLLRARLHGLLVCGQAPLVIRGDGQ